MHSYEAQFKHELDDLVVEFDSSDDVIENLKVSYKAAILHDIVISSDTSDFRHDEEGCWILESDGLPRQINELLLNAFTNPKKMKKCQQDLFWLLADRLVAYKTEDISERCSDFVEYMNPSKSIDLLDYYGVKESDFH